MKRVQIAADNVTVANVSQLGGSSPVGSGTYVDVIDSIRVAPWWTWNGSTGTPVFTYGADPAPAPLTLAGVAASIPVAAMSAPPAVADSGAIGSQTMQYAVANHTHASKARKGIGSTSAATLTWTYPTAFDPGVVPICNGIAQVANGNADLFNVQIIGDPTNTQCVFQISRVSAGLLGVLLGALSINPTPASIKLHMLALEP